MEYFVTQGSPETWAVIWDPVFTGWDSANLVHGNFSSERAATDYAETVASVLRNR